jgi:hypothetical protein
MPVGEKSSERSILPPTRAPSLWIRIDNDRHAARNELTFFPDNTQFFWHAN